MSIREDDTQPSVEVPPVAPLPDYSGPYVTIWGGPRPRPVVVIRDQWGIVMPAPGFDPDHARPVAKHENATYRAQEYAYFLGLPCDIR